MDFIVPKSRVDDITKQLACALCQSYSLTFNLQKEQEKKPSRFIFLADLCSKFNGTIYMKVRIKPLRVVRGSRSSFWELPVIVSNFHRLKAFRQLLATCFMCDDQHFSTI